MPAQPGATNDHLTITYPRRKPPVDIFYTVEGASTPGFWSTNGITEIQVTDDGNGVTETVKARDGYLMSTSTNRFLRVRIYRP